MRQFLFLLFFILIVLSPQGRAQVRCEGIFSESARSQNRQSVQINVTPQVEAEEAWPFSLSRLLESLKSSAPGGVFFNEAATLRHLQDYDVALPELGRGYSSVVYRGVLPPHFKNLFTTVDPIWVGGSTAVAIKVAKGSGIPQESLDVEAQWSARLASHDPQSLFLRYYKDHQHGVLISSLQTQFVGLDSWLDGEPHLSQEAYNRIESQFKEALAILRAAQVVHSDLGLQNILINPNTHEIKIIDYGIMAEAGAYPPLRSQLMWNKRGGRFKSANQKADKVAQYSDDEFAVLKTLEALRGRILKSLSSAPRNPSPHEIVALPPDSAEWIYLTTRNGRVSDTGFPERLHSSMSLVFEPYVDQFLQGQDVDFGSMLRAQHQILATGVDGKSRYYGASMGAWNRLLNNSAVPGKFRNEAFNGPSFFRWRLTISIQSVLNNELPSQNRRRIEPVFLEGIPANFLGTRTVGTESVVYVHPGVNSVPGVYVQAMRESLETALALMKDGHSREEILPYLADYLQRGLTGHIFSVGNFSIYMSQVNGLLRRLQFRGISPGNLDYHALVEDSDMFRQRFIDQVMAAGDQQN